VRGWNTATEMKSFDEEVTADGVRDQAYLLAGGHV
jgi:hypothetical protein